MRLAHLADAHVGPSGTQLDAETGLNSRMMDRYRCLRFCVQDSIERGAQLILFAGDFWAGPGGAGLNSVGLGSRPTPTQVGLVKQALKPALDASIPIVAICGNHDLAKAQNEWNALTLLADIDGLTVVDRPCLLAVVRLASGGYYIRDNAFALTDHPDDRAAIDRATTLQIACIPFPNASLLLRDEETRKLDPGQRNLLVREHMMSVARGLAADRVEGVPRILLGHFAVDIAEAGKQNSLAMLSNEWTLNLQEIVALGFNGVLLGHYHRRQELHHSPDIVYCGSPEATTFAEEGERKAYYLWEIPADRPLEVEVFDFVETPYRKLLTLTEVDFDRDGDLYKVEALEVRNAIVRLEIPAESLLTVDEARRAIEAAGAFEARVSKGRAESARRREVEVHGLELPEAVRIWIDQKPDLHPLAEALVAVALEVEAAMQGGVG